MQDNRVFFMIKSVDEGKIEELNTKYLKNLNFVHGSYAEMHCWNFSSKEESEEGARIIRKRILTASKK